MANIQPSLKGWSVTEASNQPDSTDSATIAGDLRAIQAGVREIYSQNTIASAATTDLGSLDEGSLTISGTTTITALGTVSAGIIKKVVFSGILTLTHNATSLILPGTANITTAANDRAEFESLGSGNWRCNWYVKANGASVSGIQDAEVTYAKLATTVISGAPAETAPAIDDLLLLSDTSAGTVDKITLENMLKVINGLTEDTSPDANGDYLLTYDNSASTVKKVLYGRGKITTGTIVVGSGTAIDFTGIPSWVKRITVMFVNISTSGTSDMIIQLGDSGGIEATGYLGSSGTIGAASAASGSYTTGFGIRHVSAADVRQGSIKIDIADPSTNGWVAEGVISISNSNQVAVTGGYKALSAALDRIRITTVNGTDTIDAGSFNICYE